jgi:hypothetical protein
MRSLTLTRTSGLELVSARTVLVASMFSAVLAAGCPDGKSGRPPKECTTAYQQCVLETGVLGVCDSVECGEGQAPPCLVCRSQH